MVLAADIQRLPHDQIAKISKSFGGVLNKWQSMIWVSRLIQEVLALHVIMA